MSDVPHSGEIVLASCFADDATPGGLFRFNGETVETVDRLSCTGMSVVGNRLLRLLGAPDEPGSTGELVVYDQRGIQRYFRLDALTDAHDIVYDGENFVITSAATNTILWVSPTGDIARSWKAPGDGDCWHLNSLFVHDGRLFVSAFGRYETHREWTRHLDDSTGFVMDVETGEDVVRNLHCPHSLRMIDGLWTLCNSASNELVQVDPSTGETVRVLHLTGWTRGLAIGEDVLYVGESADRKHRNADRYARIVVVDRKTWEVLDRRILDAPEVYDLVLATPELGEGAVRGFRTNAFRVTEQQIDEQNSTAGDDGVPRLESTPLPAADSRIRIDAQVPPLLSAGTRVSVPCSIENLGTRPLLTAPPNPVHISYCWVEAADGGGSQIVEGERHRLPGIVQAGETVNFDLTLAVPGKAGEFAVRFTLVQEMVRWFDDVDPLNARSCLVWVS